MSCVVAGELQDLEGPKMNGWTFALTLVVLLGVAGYAAYDSLYGKSSKVHRATKAGTIERHDADHVRRT
jgi:hypothetical protein